MALNLVEPCHAVPRGLTRELNKTVVAVTHDTQFAALADRRIGIVDGRIDLAWRPG